MKSAAPSWRIWLALATVYVVWGSTYLAIRVMVETMPPLLAGGARFLLAGVILAAVLVVRRGPAVLHLTWPQLGSSVLVGALLVAGGNGLVTLAEKDVPSNLAALLIASVPLWIVVLRASSGERIARGTLLGVGVGFVGVALLLLPGERPEGATALGLTLLLLAAALWALGSFTSKRLPLPADPLASTAVQMMAGGLVSTIGGIALGEIGDTHLSAFSLDSALAFAYLVTIGSLAAFTAYVWLLQNAPISLVATYAFVNPVIAVFLGWLILDEGMTGWMVAGATVIVAAVAFIVRKESPAPAATPEPAAPRLAESRAAV